ncbi:MAG: TIGR03668 family PPOX class F420-dependent oxidoreductase [Actinomycetota bacterium]|nr:TIGR03668 family PPOX class F420-dependent oxidoreductase [Actinomycetota bacterium]
MSLDPERALQLVAEEPVARLATVTAEGRVDLVPITFALLEARPDHRWDLGVLVTAVDHKPKRSPDLQRLENVRAYPEVTLLVDHYSDDWDQLWWVRLRGQARVLGNDPSEVDEALDALCARYGQYREQRPAGPVIAIDLSSVQGWSATSR